jgi:hypothetical protein
MDKRRAVVNSALNIYFFLYKGKGKVQPCTGTEAMYRQYGP